MENNKIERGRLLMKKGSLEELNKSLNFYKHSVIILWILILFFLYLFKTSGNFVDTSLDDLNSIGGTFNIVTSLTGVVTVFLVAKALLFQKEELISIKEQIKTQKESLENEEKTNRTIKFIEEWISFAQKKIGRQNYIAYFRRLKDIHDNEYYREKIDFSFLKKIIINDGGVERLRRYILEIKVENKKMENGQDSLGSPEKIDMNNRQSEFILDMIEFLEAN